MPKTRRKRHTTALKCFLSCYTNATQEKNQWQVKAFSLNILWQKRSNPSQNHLITEDAHALHVTPMKTWLCGGTQDSVLSQTHISQRQTFHFIRTISVGGMREIQVSDTHEGPRKQISAFDSLPPQNTHRMCVSILQHQIQTQSWFVAE